MCSIKNEAGQDFVKRKLFARSASVANIAMLKLMPARVA